MLACWDIGLELVLDKIEEAKTHLGIGSFMAKRSNIEIIKLRSAPWTLFGGLQQFICSPVQQFKPEISFLGLTGGGGEPAAVPLLSRSLSAERDLLLKERPAQHSGFRYTLHRACSEWEQWLKMELIHSTAMQYRHTTECGLCVCFCAYLLALFLCFRASHFSSLVEVVFSEIHTCKCVLSTCNDNQA